MNDKLTELEKLLEEQSRASNFSPTELSIYPETFRHIHSYKLFGKNLLSIPANLLIKGEDGEFEKPFNFIDDMKAINIFESEFRGEISNEFVQIGNLFGSTEIVLLNKLNNRVHVFNVSDITDKSRMKRKLNNSICGLTTLIGNIRPQTVCCLMNPKNYSKYEILEIRNNTTIVTKDFKKELENTSETWKEYLNIVKKAIDTGFEIHYAPKKVIDELNNKSTNG